MTHNIVETGSKRRQMKTMRVLGFYFKFNIGLNVNYKLS